MATLSKRQRHDLEQVQALLMRVQNWLLSDGIAIARTGGVATTTLHYTRADGATLYPITKDIGCDLVLLGTAISDLHRFINPPIIDN